MQFTFAYAIIKKRQEFFFSKFINLTKTNSNAIRTYLELDAHENMSISIACRLGLAKLFYSSKFILNSFEIF